MNTNHQTQSSTNRRKFLTAGSTIAMAGGLAAGYGTFGVYAGRFLYPTDDDTLGWQFVSTVDEFSVGDSREFIAPSGAKVVIARQGETNDASAFIALSSVCPHLGCQVRWEPQNNRFFCPCHNGAFDPQGVATEGPPAKAKQALLQFRVKVENELLYVEVPLKSVTQGDVVGRIANPSHGKGELA